MPYLQSTLSTLDVTFQLVKHLKVKVARSSIKKIIELHPDRGSILSISDVLKEWKVDNYVLQVDKDKLAQLPTPFIAHLKSTNSFITVTDVAQNHIIFDAETKEKLIQYNLNDFLQEWSGVSLIAEATNESGEQNHEEGFLKKRELSLKQPTLVLTILLFSASAVLYHLNSFDSPGPYLLMLTTKFVGCVITIILLSYEVTKSDHLIKKICGISKRTSCSAVISSKHAKIFNLISWSEIGFVYFVGGYVALLIAGQRNLQILQVFAALSLLTLPYTCFSIFYQWRIAKQWCILCLIVQATLLLEICGSLINDLCTPAVYLSFNSHYAKAFALITASFSISAVCWFFLKPLLLTKLEFKLNKRELARLKSDDQIFEALLSKQDKLESNSSKALGIILGNPYASNQIIKVCNPYCGYCSKAHIELNKLLEIKKDLGLQIIFSATNDPDDERFVPVRHILSIAEHNDEAFTKKALDDWYLSKSKDYSVFASKYPQTGNMAKQESKINAMSKWCRQNNISVTPTIFVNGYKLPDVYSIEDLKYIL